MFVFILADFSCPCKRISCFQRRNTFSKIAYIGYESKTLLIQQGKKVLFDDTYGKDFTYGSRKYA